MFWYLKVRQIFMHICMIISFEFMRQNIRIVYKMKFSIDDNWSKRNYVQFTSWWLNSIHWFHYLLWHISFYRIFLVYAEFAVKAQYMHKDSKLIADVPCFAELVWTCLWVVWAEQHATVISTSAHRPARKELNLPKVESI